MLSIIAEKREADRVLLLEQKQDGSGVLWITFSEALEWLAKMEEVEGVGSSLNHSRFFRLLAAKPPEGV